MPPPTGEGGGGDGDAFSFRTSSSSSSHAPEDSSGFLLSNEDRRNQRRKSSETTENIDFDDGNENKKNTNNNNTFASALEEEEEEEEEERVGRRAEETATAMMMHSMREEEDKHNQHGVLRWSFSQVFGERAPNEEVQDADIISAVEFDRTGDWLATGDRGGRVVLFERVRQTKRASKQHPEDELEDVLMEEMSSEMQYNRDDQVGVMINNNDDNNNNNNNASTSGNHNTTNEQQKLGENGRNEYNTRPEQVEFRYLTEFQSHEPEFDYLKSLEIEEKINTLKWCHQGANEGRFVLSTNDKTIKLWKVFEKRAEAVSGFNRDSNDSINTTTTATHNWGGNTTSNRNNNSNNNNNNNKGNAAGSTEYRLKIPRVLKGELGFNARCRRCYANAHAYHINSLSVNSDGETFISADDLRVNLWHLERSNGSFNIVDIKPENMEELTEVITSACFHPSHCQHFAYSSSKGTIRLADMRINASCNAASKSFEEPEPVEKRSFFSEIIASVSDVKFSKDGRYFLSRDYLTLKLWDVNMEKSPLATFNVHDHLRPRLCDLYEKDSIFDKFQCCIRGDGKYVASGSYNANLRCFNAFEPGSEGTTTEITSRMPPRRSESAFGNGGTTREDLFVAGAKTPPISLANSHHYQNLSDFSSNILHAAWHPEEDILACGVSNSLYIFNA